MTTPPSRVGRASTRTARSTLLYVFGDLVHPSPDAVSTAALLSALADNGHEAAAGRQALLRSAKAGWIEAERRGRETWWSITEQGHGLIADGLRRIADLGADNSDWDGRWVVVAVTIPHERRAIRERVYRYLAWSGFGMPATGLWVSPNVRNEGGARFAIHHFGLEDSSASFIGSSATIGMTEARLVERAWNLEGLDAHYAALVARHRPDDVRSGRDALRALLDLDADLQLLPLLDPQLPEQLSRDRSGREAARTLLTLRTQWLQSARAYWRPTP